MTIASNQIFTLLGPSGCGKTTLLRCIVGLETPDAGEIAIGDEIVYSRDKGILLPPEKWRLGMVFQIYVIWPHMSVFDNVAYPLRTRKITKTEICSSGWRWQGRWWPNPKLSGSMSPSAIWMQNSGKSPGRSCAGF
jgi:ABC-type Fe3+/spermidine/putrescine transport system ATPase subunit